MMSRKLLRIQTPSSGASRLAALITLAVTLMLPGCGSGGGSESNSADRTAVALSSISVTPSNPTILVGNGQQFDAMGAYTDGSKKNVTSSVTWSSSNPSAATINSLGMASGIANGSSTITASMNGKSGTATLNVAALNSISVSPLNPSIAAGATQQFFASANYSNHATEDVTASATWASSDTTKATVESQGAANPGLASGLDAGSVSITATFSGKSGSSTLNVTGRSGNATLIPLMDMTPVQNYLSFPGGLYENSTDLVPSDHSMAGLAAGGQIEPLDTNGNPSPTGKIVFLSIGRSNAVDEFTVFVSQAAANSGVNHTTLAVLNGALSAALPCVWTTAVGTPTCSASLGNQYDRIRDTVLTPAGLTEKQVQVIWVENYDADPGGSGYQTLCDPSVAGCSNDVSRTEALYFEQQIGATLRAAKSRWPNLRQAFQSSRIYGGYSVTDHSSEPYCYEYGFAVKWLIEAQIVQNRSGTIDPIAGDLNYSNGTAPWTAWGPYLWANGDTPRSDGLVWCNGQTGPPCNGEVDYQADGTHPNPNGQTKASNLLMNFFLNSSFTPWFRP